jgi:hypothetical protein
VKPVSDGRMRHLIAETERRAGEGQEYEQLLADMEGHYLSCRYQLISQCCGSEFHFRKLDPDPHQNEKQDPYAYQREKQDPDPHQIEKVEALKD